jgi:DNA-binding NarL/FixJ family response regulator
VAVRQRASGEFAELDVVVPSPNGESAGVRRTAFVVEPEPLYAEVLALELEEAGLQVSRTSSGREAARDAVVESDPDIVLVDLDRDDGGGLELARDVLTLLPRAKVVVLTRSTGIAVVRRVLEEGFHGYLTKDMPAVELLSSIQAALEGKVVIRHVTARQLPSHTPVEGPDLLARQLTHREREVLRHMVDGASSEAIARRLWISVHTVRTHTQAILIKLQVHSRLEAVVFARRHGVS